MKKYLFTTLPSNDLGLLTRSLPIALELRSLGHDAVFCSPARSPRKLISEAGFENLLPTQAPYYLISGELSFENIRRYFKSKNKRRDFGILFSIMANGGKSLTSEIWNLDHFMYMFGMWNENFIRTCVEAMVDIIRRYQPDVVVDFWNPFSCIAARAAGKPLVTVIQSDIYPGGKGFIWWKPAPPDLPTSVPAINTVLAEYDLPRISDICELMVGDLTLVVGQPETDPLPAGAKGTHIGPVLWQGGNEELPDWVEELGGDRPLIWLYPGNVKYFRGADTPFDSAVVLKGCIEGLGGEDVQVVLTTGYNTLPKQFRPLPSNFRHEVYVPGLAMAAKCDLLIHHGGYGSCQTGLYAGKPSLIIPTMTERESNARRIADQNAGDLIIPKSDERGRKKRIPAEEVREKALRILSDSSYRANAQRISDIMKSYGAAAWAAEMIAGL